MIWRYLLDILFYSAASFYLIIYNLAVEMCDTHIVLTNYSIFF